MRNVGFNILLLYCKERVTDVEGKQVWSPMWLIAIGSRRHQLTCLDIYQSYRQRFDLEHLWRFGKQRLLMTAFHTPEVKHEVHWVQLTLLAYTQLWVARELAQHLPRQEGTLSTKPCQSPNHSFSSTNWSLDYDSKERRRLVVTPGLSGLWQASGRSDLAWEDGIRLDLYYVENWSLTADLIILWKTFGAVMQGRGAY